MGPASYNRLQQTQGINPGSFCYAANTKSQMLHQCSFQTLSE